MISAPKSPGSISGVSPGLLPSIRRNTCSKSGRMLRKFHQNRTEDRAGCRSAAGDRVICRSRASHRRIQAFTIAEILVTVFLLAVATLSLYAGFTSGFMLVDSARNELRATQILTQKAEALRLCSWSSLTNCPISFVEQYDSPSNGISTVAAGTVYVGTVTTNVATPIPDTCGYKTNMCMATISLFWTNVYGKQVVVHNRSLQTLISRYGIQNYIWGATP